MHRAPQKNGSHFKVNYLRERLRKSCRGRPIAVKRVISFLGCSLDSQTAVSTPAVLGPARSAAAQLRGVEVTSPRGSEAAFPAGHAWLRGAGRGTSASPPGCGAAGRLRRGPRGTAGGRPLLGAPHPRRWEGAGQAAAVPGMRLAASRGRARPVPDGVYKFPARPRSRTDCWRPAPRRPFASPRLRFSLAAAWSFLPPLLCSGGSPPPPPQVFSSGHCPAFPPPRARTARSQRPPIPAVFCSQLRLGLSLAFLSFPPPGQPPL